MDGRQLRHSVGDPMVESARSQYCRSVGMGLAMKSAVVASVCAVMARSDTFSDSSGTDDRPRPAEVGPQPDAGRSRRAGLTVAISVAGVGALLIGLAPLVGVVAPSAPPAFTSWPLLLLLAALPPLLAIAFVRQGNRAVAAAVLLGPAVVAPGRMIVDGQLFVDAGLAARPELLLPAVLDRLTPSLGAGLLLAGHIVTCVAGIVAMASSSGEFESQGPGSAFESEKDGQVRFGGQRQGRLAVALCVGIVAGVGILAAQFVSGNPFLIPRGALDSPVMVMIGCLWMAVAVPVAAGVAAGSADPDLAHGGLLGLAVSVAGVAVPPLVAAIVVDNVSVEWGPIVALVAVAGMVLLGRQALSPGTSAASRPPALNRLLLVSGGLSVIAALFAAAGALLPSLVGLGPGAVSSPHSTRLLLLGAAVLIVLGTGVLVPRFATVLRPALAAGWAVMSLAAFAAYVGTTGWAVAAALCASLLAAVAAGAAGAVERDDLDLSEIKVSTPVAVPAAASLLFALGAFCFPVVTAPLYEEPGIFAHFSTPSWGLVIALLVVISAVLLAPVSRPNRAVASLGGAVLVVLVRVLDLPLSAGRTAGIEPGWGLWCGLACVAGMVLTAAVAVWQGKTQSRELSTSSLPKSE